MSIAGQKMAYASLIRAGVQGKTASKICRINRQIDRRHFWMKQLEAYRTPIAGTVHSLVGKSLRKKEQKLVVLLRTIPSAQRQQTLANSNDGGLRNSCLGAGAILSAVGLAGGYLTLQYLVPAVESGVIPSIILAGFLASLYRGVSLIVSGFKHRELDGLSVYIRQSLHPQP